MKIVKKIIFLCLSLIGSCNTPSERVTISCKEDKVLQGFICGDSVNSESNEFAPYYYNDKLYFTSNHKGEFQYAYSTTKPKMDSARIHIINLELIKKFNNPNANIGDIVFFRNDGQGFLSSNAKNNIMDLYIFQMNNTNDLVSYSFECLDYSNFRNKVSSWNSQPTWDISFNFGKFGKICLIFTSNRNEFNSIFGRDPRLFYIFGDFTDKTYDLFKVKWGAVKELDFINRQFRSVETPFLSVLNNYCCPTLLFSALQGSKNYKIYFTDIFIDYENDSISSNVMTRPIQLNDSIINSMPGFDDKYPFIYNDVTKTRFYQEAKQNVILFSSNRQLNNDYNLFKFTLPEKLLLTDSTLDYLCVDLEKEFDSVNKAVPYFLSGFWKVNENVTSFNKYWDNLIRGGIYDFNWVEGHQSSLSRNNNTKANYYNYSQVVDQILSDMTNIFVEYIPKILKQFANSGNEDKLFIEITGVTDPHPLSINDFSIDDKFIYKENQKYGQISKSRVLLNNAVLSKLRGYYGFSSIFNRMWGTLLKNKYFKQTIEDDEILLPGKFDELVSDYEHIVANSPNDYSTDNIKKKKIIVIIKGRETKLGEENEVNYPNIRRVEVKMEVRRNGDKLINKCCENLRKKR